jgi:hypothetical protein
MDKSIDKVIKKHSYNPKIINNNAKFIKFMHKHHNYLRSNKYKIKVQHKKT